MWAVSPVKPKTKLPIKPNSPCFLTLKEHSCCSFTRAGLLYFLKGGAESNWLRALQAPTKTEHILTPHWSTGVTNNCNHIGHDSSSPCLCWTLKSHQILQLGQWLYASNKPFSLQPFRHEGISWTQVFVMILIKIQFHSVQTESGGGCGACWFTGESLNKWNVTLISIIRKAWDKSQHNFDWLKMWLIWHFMSNITAKVDIKIRTQVVSSQFIITNSVETLLGERKH